MIVKMKRYSFLVHHLEYTNFLDTLQNTGVVHVVEKNDLSLEDKEIVRKGRILQQIKETVNFFKTKKVEKSEVESNLDPLEIIEQVKYNRQNLDLQKNDLQGVQKELALLLPWGSFSLETIGKLKESGQYVHFFNCPTTKIDKQWKDNYFLFNISEIGSLSYFVIVTDSSQAPDIKANILVLPQKSLKELQETEADIKLEIKEIEKKLEHFAASGIDKLNDYSEVVKTEKQYHTVALQSVDEADSKLKLLEGWVPLDKETELSSALDLQCVYYQSRNVIETDDAPVLLKNNAFARLFEPIGKLYALPSYREIDLTPYYAPFYWLFFGFCLGDAGYGILIVIAGIIASIKTKGNVKQLMKLVALLGVSTILFGIISGTFFGIGLYDKKWWFYNDLSIMLANRGKTINDVLFSMAIALGGFQIIFGMFIKAANEIKQFGFKYSVATFGWIILILGSAVFYALPKDVALGLKPVQYIIYGVSGVMIFLLNSPGKNVFTNVGSGLWGAYNMATGLLGDILSYIRLFALGISSAILGFVFNMLSAQLSGSVPVISFLIMVVILLFGHGLNLFMAMLGSFVHSMRLTFVEFYKNSNFNGGGKEYRPFKAKQ